MTERTSDRLARLMANQPTAGDLEWLSVGFRTWARLDGAVTLLRCLSLPSTPTAVRLARRDDALRAAAALCAGRSLRQRAHQLRARLSVFAERGLWRLWRRAGGAPENATDLERQLFEVLDFNHGRVLGARQIERIVKASATPIALEMSAHPDDHVDIDNHHGGHLMTTDFIDLDALEAQIAREWERPEIRAEFGGDRERYAAFRRAESHGLTRVFDNGKASTTARHQIHIDAAAGWNDPKTREEFGGNRQAWEAYCSAMKMGRVRIVSSTPTVPDTAAPAAGQPFVTSSRGNDGDIVDPPLTPPTDTTRAIDRMPGRLVIAGTSIPYSPSWEPWRKRMALDEWERHKAQTARNTQGAKQ